MARQVTPVDWSVEGSLLMSSGSSKEAAFMVAAQLPAVIDVRYQAGFGSRGCLGTQKGSNKVRGCIQ